MAVNIPIRLKTQAQGCFADGRDWTYDIRIHDADWSGVVSDFSLYESGVKIEWTGNEEDIFFPVLPSTVTLQIWVDGPIIQQFVEDLQLVQENRFYISILKNGVEVYWRGTVLQDQTRTEDNRGCEAFTCKVVAACGLARLKDVSYDVPYVFSYYNHMAYIVQLLNKVVPPGLFEVTDDYVGSNVTFYDEQMPPTDGLLITEPLVYVKTEREGLLLSIDDNGNVTEINSFDAVSRIIRSYNARIFMFNGIFFITQVRDLEDSVLFNFYNKSYSAPPTPNMTPFAAGANALNVDYAIRQPLDYPIESNEYAYYPEVKAVRVRYDSEAAPFLMNESPLVTGTVYRSVSQVPQNSQAVINFLKGYFSQANNVFNINIELTITAVFSGVTNYLVFNGGALTWTTTPGVIVISEIGSYAVVAPVLVTRSYTTPAFATSSLLFVEFNIIIESGVTISASPSDQVIKAEANPKLTQLVYQSENLNSNSTIIKEVDGPLLNDGELFLAPESQVWNGTAWVNLKDWAEGAPPAPGTAEPYPSFLARQMLELQDGPRAKYYGSFWDDIAPINLFYYDTKKYVLTKATLLIGESQWDVTMVEIDQVPATIANDGPGNGGTPPTFSIQPPINPTDGPLTWNINANLNGNVLLPGVNYIPFNPQEVYVPARTIQYVNRYTLISNKQTIDLPDVSSPDWDLLAYNSAGDLGWAIYTDSVSSDFVILDIPTFLTIDGLGTDTNTDYLPAAATAPLWSDNKITPIALGDSYNLRIDLEITAKTQNPASIALALDINPDGSPIIIAEKEISTSKTAPYTISVALPIFTLNTFVANGGAILLQTSSGEITVGNRSILIVRTSTST